MNNDIRWKQRFQNFEKAILRLEEALQTGDLSELERNGLIQRFEFTIELCKNTLQDYLIGEGVQYKPTPKETIRQAFKSGIIDNAQDLIDAIDLRNELSHDYNEEKFEAAEETIRIRVYPAIKSVYLFFSNMIKSDQTDLFDE